MRSQAGMSESRGATARDSLGFQPEGAVRRCKENRLGGRGWTEPAKEAPGLRLIEPTRIFCSRPLPGFHSCLVPTPATQLRSLIQKVLFRNSGAVVERAAVNDNNSGNGRLTNVDEVAGRSVGDDGFNGVKLSNLHPRRARHDLCFCHSLVSNSGSGRPTERFAQSRLD